MRTCFNSHIALFFFSFFFNKACRKWTNWKLGYSNIPQHHSSRWDFFTMFFSELSVLEHITKPQRPNVFSEEFGLCFWPKTFQHHLLLIYPAIKNKKRGEEKKGKKK